MARVLRGVCALLIGTSILFSGADARIVINEFMTANVSTYPDLWDYDDFPDWIELYNDSSVVVDLSGYYLTDNFNTIGKWAIPSGTHIPAKGFFTVFADGYDAAPGKVDTRTYFPYNITFTTRNYHAGFKLSDGGEEIGLSRKTGAGFFLVDSVVFSQQLPDISMGRNPNDNMKWYQYDEPTPGAANTTPPKNTLKYSPPVSFSITGGFYDAAQTLSLSAPFNAPIYYTTDGSAPTAASNGYSSPITVEATTIIKARSIDSILLAGPVATNTYFIGEKKRSLMAVSIVADSSYLWDSAFGMYKNSLKGREIPASLEFYGVDGRLATRVRAGISPGSLTSYLSPQKPLQVSLKGSKYGDDFIWHQLFGKPIACFTRIRFRNSGDAWATNLMADGLVETVCREQMDNATQAYRPVVIYLNGRYWGIQDMREQFDPQFFTSNFNVDPSTLNDVRTTVLPPAPGHEGWEVSEGTWDDYQTLMSLVKKADMSDSLTFGKIAASMDVYSFMDFMSMEDYAVNISWGHNIELWKVRGRSWQWLLTDFDRGFMIKKVAINLFTNGGGGLSGSIMPKDTLFTTLINNAEFKNRFVQRFAAHLNSTFHPARMTAIIDSVSTLLEPEMPDHIERWKADTGIQSMDEWNAEVANLKQFAAQRPAIVVAQLAAQFNLAGTARLTIALSKSGAGDIYVNGVKMCNGADSMTYFKGIPLHLRAVARPGYAFVRWDSAGTSDTMSVTIDSDDTLTAVFEESGTHGIPSVITSNTTLDKTDFPYAANGDVSIEKGATLTIAEGVSVVMPSKAGIYVQGRLLIRGSSSKPVRIGPDSANGAVDWGAICFDGAEDTCKIEYAIITGTTLGRDALNHRAGINGNYSNVVMDHLTMSNIIYPMYFEYGSTVLRNSSITIDHICNGGIHIGRGDALVENNRWVSTGKTINTDAVDIKGVDKGIVRGNRIFNFNGFNSDGIDLGEHATNILIEGNYIYGNRDKGISCGGQSTCRVKNNIVAACDLGIGVKDSGSFAELEGNTFVRNNKGIAVYEKAFPRGGGSVIARNMIISASKLASVEADSKSTLDISYSLSDMDIMTGAGNMIGDPRFVDPLGNDFQVAEGSISINAGDPESPRDPDGSRADIGASYNYQSDDFPVSVTGRYAPPAIVINEIMHKAASGDSLLDWIELYNPRTDPVSIAHWCLNDENPDNAFSFPSGATVNSGGYLVVCRDTAAFKLSYPSVKTITGNLGFGLGVAERVVLADSGGNEITSMRYKSETPWFVEADGKGPSLELIDPGNVNHLTINWGASKNSGGTPGAKNSIFDAYVKPGIAAANTTRLLLCAYPNPLKTFTSISFMVPDKSRVTVSIFSVNGKKIETLLDGELKPGSHRVRWLARAYSSGIYFCHIKTSRYAQTRKLFIQ
jgi:parallel beta-helix repeat protein